MPVSARIEEEISQLDGDEKAMFLEELNMTNQVLTDLSKQATHCLVLSVTLQPANLKFVHGLSQKEQKHLKRQVKFIQTLSVDLSVRKLFTMTTLWNAEV